MSHILLQINVSNNPVKEHDKKIFFISEVQKETIKIKMAFTKY